MKEWTWILIILALFGKLAKNLLPKGEKSPLYSPLRFLLSLSLIIVLFSPWIPLLKGERELMEFPSISAEEVEESGEILVLKRLGSTLGENVQSAFPDAKFSLEIHTDENKVPVLVKVVSEERNTAIQIAAYIKTNYDLEAVAK